LDPQANKQAYPEVHIFVNRRAVFSKEIKEWLSEIYMLHTQHNKAVDCVLFLEIPPQQLDINVHPTKREVRFSNRLQLKAFFTRAIVNAIQKRSTGNHVNTYNIEYNEVGKKQPHEAAGFSNGRTASECANEKNLKKNRLTQSTPATGITYAIGDLQIDNLSDNSDIAKIETTSIESTQAIAHNISESCSADSKPDNYVSFAAPVVSRSRGILNWRYIGKMDSNCALFASECGLIFLDLKAANTRIQYEKLLAEVNYPQQQPLLMPIQLDFRRQDLEDISSAIAELRTIGFAIEVTNDRRCTVSTIPIWLDEHSGETFLYDWLFLQCKRCNCLRTEFLLKLAAQHCADRHMPSTEMEIIELLRSLMNCDMPAISPNGSAIYFELSHNDIQRRWSRIA
jgi:DNA mismatch repair protein MutL